MGLKDLSPKVISLYHFLKYAVIPFQATLFLLAWGFFKIYFKFKPKEPYKRKMAIGVTETARIIFLLGEVFPSRYVCVLDKNPFYKDKYDFGPYPILLRPFAGPIILAFLSETCETFFYISFTGYFVDRSFDFWLLKKLNKKIVTLFCGSDIRSLKKTKEFFDARGEDSYAHYLPNADSAVYDDLVRRTGRAADKYADLVFNWTYDQMGYMDKKALPWPYMTDMKALTYEFKKPPTKESIVVFHASGHPVFKGTQLIRAAVKKLKEEGYKFDYKECIRVPYEEVIRRLAESHIVMQEFYALVPGSFGIEAMAKGNAVLMSADPSINPDLPKESSGAWFVTRYWQVYDNLKHLLDNPEKIESYALNGRKLVESHYSYEKAREYYHAKLSEYSIPF